MAIFMTDVNVGLPNSRSEPMRCALQEAFGQLVNAVTYFWAEDR